MEEEDKEQINTCEKKRQQRYLHLQCTIVLENQLLAGNISRIFYRTQQKVTQFHTV